MLTTDETLLDAVGGLGDVVGVPLGFGDVVGDLAGVVEGGKSPIGRDFSRLKNGRTLSSLSNQTGKVAVWRLSGTLWKALAAL